MKTTTRGSGASRPAVKPPPGGLDPIVEEELDRLAAQYGDSQREAEAILSDPAYAERIRSITNRLNHAPLDPLIRTVLSRPPIYETCLYQALATEEADDPEARMAKAIEALAQREDAEARRDDLARADERLSDARIAEAMQDIGEALGKIAAVQEQQTEALQTALVELRATRPPGVSQGAPVTAGDEIATTAEALPGTPEGTVVQEQQAGALQTGLVDPALHRPAESQGTLPTSGGEAPTDDESTSTGNQKENPV